MPQIDITLLFNFIFFFSLAYLFLYFINIRFPLIESTRVLKYKFKIFDFFSDLFSDLKKNFFSLLKIVITWFNSFK